MTMENYDYDPSYYHRSLQQNQPVAILVVAYNRPEYFKEVIVSLERNPESCTLHFYFFLDGGPGAKQEENKMIIINSKIKNKEIITRKRNYGCAKNLIDARRFMFDWCKYEKIIVIEDDIIVSPHYIRTLLALHQWAKQNYRNIGVVQCWSYCFLNSEEKRKKLPLVQNNETYWWSFVSYCLDQEVWHALRPLLYEYETRFVDKIPWTEDFFKERSKPSLSSVGSDIRTWVKHIIDIQGPKLDKEGPYFKTNIDLRAIFASINYDITNQDVMTGFALWMAGYVKIETVVNRARHIGKYGITVDEKLFKLLHHDKITLDHFDEDATLTDFEEVSQ
ncbi:hypothetical protein QFZ73_004816 [Peribacillus sp. V2I11]|nr:hypothetical protein [Peribacillus sp. V2I11]